MKNPDIDIIKNKFLEYIASLIEIKTRKKVETEEKIECLNYTTSLLNLINKSKDFFITSLRKWRWKRYIYNDNVNYIFKRRNRRITK